MEQPLSNPLLRALAGDDEVGALFSDAADVAAMVRVEEALTVAEAEAGLVGRDAAGTIAAALRAFEPDWTGLTEGIRRDGVVVPELVRQIRAAVGGEAAKAVHLGATSQDIIDTSLMLRLKSLVDLYRRRLEALIEALGGLEGRDGAIPLMAHTRMQEALPHTAAAKIRTWRDPLVRQHEALLALAPGLLALQLGGPVGTRAEFRGQGDRVAEAMAESLGLAVVPPWHSQRDRIAAFASWLSILSGTLGKIGQDVALLAQNEVGAVRIASGGGSSAMPHKQNPVQAELLVTLARFNAGLVGTLHQALVHENERSGAAWTLEWLVLPRMAEATGAGLRLALKLIEGLSFAPAGAE